MEVESRVTRIFEAGDQDAREVGNYFEETITKVSLLSQIANAEASLFNVD